MCLIGRQTQFRILAGAAKWSIGAVRVPSETSTYWSCINEDPRERKVSVNINL